MIDQTIIEDVLEMYHNETDDYDDIADRCDLSVTDVANIINDWNDND
jgi:hypothetical protein